MTAILHEVENLVEGKHMLSMQDISNWQGSTATKNVEKHEVLAIKCTEGNNFHDVDFLENWEFARTNEKTRVAYHLFHPSIPGLQQASYFLTAINGHLQTGDQLAIDLELTDGQLPETVDKEAKEFLDYVKSQTKATPWVYTYRYFAEAGNCESLGEFPLWIADPSTPPARPHVPGPWKDWLAHQYGVFRGIDADVVNVTSVEQLDKYGALIGDPKPPEHIVVLNLTDGKAVKTAEIHQETTVGDLRGQVFEAGDARLEFTN